MATTVDLRDVGVLACYECECRGWKGDVGFVFLVGESAVGDRKGVEIQEPFLSTEVRFFSFATSGEVSYKFGAW